MVVPRRQRQTQRQMTERRPSKVRTATPPGRASFSMAARRARAQRVTAALEQLYPSPKCELDYRTPFQLLIAVILSAQTTDKRVNLITPRLFERYPDAAALAKAELSDLYEILRPIGFYRAKARAIRQTAELLVKNHRGEVPRTLEELVKLRGVGRKTANVVLGEAFGSPQGIAVDTHVQRVARRLGLTRAQTVRGVEEDLMELIPRERWAKDHLRMVLFGRYLCVARAPKCDRCPVRSDCFAPEARKPRVGDAN